MKQTLVGLYPPPPRPVVSGGEFANVEHVWSMPVSVALAKRDKKLRTTRHEALEGGETSEPSCFGFFREEIFCEIRVSCDHADLPIGALLEFGEK